ncbi:HD-GYP domain-containing protein [Metabacillus sp. GX 13764]|uniref:HD-GYP domain-containing protein n=1 Tax=Metabacillus kandeliae TaxID=2900151 RepID=UPI001E5E11CC|nr:HD-GYP domain-containing protein [Metabacillus kandeliae]MCD7035458.1 HD-GYP domain-containing protein [Metabacillus kandeliae]
MMVYRNFFRTAVKNYLIGSAAAVFGIGAIFMFSTLRMTGNEMLLLGGILSVSFAVMILAELAFFTFHTRPIRDVLLTDLPPADALVSAYKRAHQFPMYTVFRIYGPHLFGFSIPALLLTILSIKWKLLNFPVYYVFLAMLGAILIAGMHSVIEFFLSSQAIKPVLNILKERTFKIHKIDLAMEANVYVSIRHKIMFSAIYIGVFPLVLFSLATQVHITEAGLSISGEYWRWAGIVLVMSLLFSVLGAYLLFHNIVDPITSLLHGIRQVEKGDFSYKGEIYSDEFSRLIAGYNQMIDGLKERDKINSELLDSFFHTLAVALDAKDINTAGHSVRVSEYAVIIGESAGLQHSELEQLKKSALLHDVGKIGIRDDILLKEGRLTEEEFEEIKKHPVIGASILSKVQPADAMASLIPGVRYHHERFDGLGYPEGKKGNDIPVFGRILAVADAFDAMTSDRPYRDGMPVHKALQIIEKGKGTQWDPYYAQLFLDIMQSKNAGQAASE